MKKQKPDSKELIKSALIKIRQMRGELKKHENERTEPIAIIGMACRFPGADSPEDFWTLLKEGRSSVSQVPKERWDVDAFYDSDPDVPGKLNTRYGGYIGSLDGFDASFFDISAREAACMDPQQRLALEVAWETLENANINPQSIYGSNCGVFLGIGNWENAVLRFGIGHPDKIGPYEGTGSSNCVAAGRIAYVLGLTGPNMAVDTACSSSLLSAHLASESLRRRECDMALAGGSHLLLLPGMSISMTHARMLSPDGRCKTFDAAANGYVRGEGVGMMALKRLSDAERDGDKIFALIRGSAVNQDGSSGGLTVPSGPSQEQVIQKALVSARLTPNDVGYIEAHGTGTPLGDPIELRSIGNVFCKNKRPQPLMVGSVKTNIGHLESSAGISALIKTTLMLSRGQIPPLLHLKTPNPLIDWDNLDVEIPLELKPWEIEPDRTRIAGISSFGFSGTNVHTILSEYIQPEQIDVQEEKPEEKPGEKSDTPYLLTLSARQPSALSNLAEKYVKFLSDHPDTHPGDLCFTSMTCRAQFRYRLAVIGKSCVEMIKGLKRFLNHETHPDLFFDTGTKTPLPKALPDLAKLPGESDKRFSVYRTLAEHFVNGANPEWSLLYRENWVKRIPLPNYPFQRLSFPVNPFGAVTGGVNIRKPDQHPLLGTPVVNALKEIFFDNLISPDDPPYLSGHKVYGRCLLPGAAYAEMVLKAAALQYAGALPMIEKIDFQAPLLLDGSRRIQLILKPAERSVYEFQIFSNSREADESWTLHAAGRVSPGAKIQKDSEENMFDLPETMAESFSEKIAPSDYYQDLARSGFDYKGGFVSLSNIYRKEGEAFGCVELNMNQVKDADLETYIFHPILLDGCLQLVNCLTPEKDDDTLFMPVGLTGLHLLRKTEPKFWVHARTISSSGDHFSADLTLILESGEIMGEIKGVQGRSVSTRTVLDQLEKPLRENLYDLVWRFIPQSRDIHPSFDSVPSFYLLFCPPEVSVGAELTQALEDHGHRVVLAVPGESFSISDALVCSLDPKDPDHYKRLLESITEVQGTLQGIIHLWSLGESSESQMNMDDDRGWVSLLHLVQAAGRLNLKMAQGLWVVTRGMICVVGEEMVSPPLHASLWGLSRVLMQEYPELNSCCLDLDVQDSDPAGTLLRSLRFQDGENQIAWRGEKRYCPRLISHESFPDPENEPIRVCLKSYDGLESLECVPLKRTPPEADQVEIQVHSAGLNFRDVLHALGMMRDITEGMGIGTAQDLPLGFECSGTVVAKGRTVTHVDIGDQVVAAMSGGCLASFVTVPGAHVITKPEGISFKAAATITTTFLTAYYGLVTLADIKKGERVLIHAAAGGVGMAALQLAREKGAVIFATASRSKWNRVKAMGAKYVMDSRSTEFSSEIREYTQGKGVDVVLNSLTGEFIDHSFNVLKTGARFIEIGKIGVWTPEDAASKRPDADYHLFDMNDVARREPELITRMLHEMKTQIESGQFKPLPFDAFGVNKVRDAFSHMARAEHVGKVVVTINPSHGGGSGPGGTCLITGGTGALGLEMADHLISKDFSHLVLVNRSEPGAESLSIIKRLRETGADIRVMFADVSNPEQMRRLWSEMKDSGIPPLKGILHAAGVLEDSMLMDQDVNSFKYVLGPKVMGAWNLHQLSLEEDLDFFVMFSSVASLVGNAGQASYAAANACLDSIAHYRRVSGLPATSVNWGAWDIGMGESRLRLSVRGAKPLSASDGKALFQMIINQNPVQISALAMDWDVLSEQWIGPLPHILSEIHGVNMDSANPHEPSDMMIQLKDAGTEGRHSFLLNYTEQLACHVLGSTQGQGHLITDKPLMEQGFDSLMAVELRNRLGRETGKVLPASMLFDYPTLEKVTLYLLEDVIVFEEDTGDTRNKEDVDTLSANDVLDELDFLLDN